MKIFTDGVYARLLENAKDHGQDHVPVVSIQAPEHRLIWLLTKVYPKNVDIAFGLCDPGMGFPEIGDVSVSEILRVYACLGLHIDMGFHQKASFPLSVYAKAASIQQAITLDPQKLLNAQACRLNRMGRN